MVIPEESSIFLPCAALIKLSLKNLKTSVYINLLEKANQATTVAFTRGEAYS